LGRAAGFNPVAWLAALTKRNSAAVQVSRNKKAKQ